MINLEGLHSHPFFATVGATSSRALPANSRRRAIQFISTARRAAEVREAATVVANDADSATTGVKLTYTAPAGVEAVVLSSSNIATGGAPNVQLRATIGGVTVVLLSTTTNGMRENSIPLDAGDSVDWNVSTAVAATTVDLTISAIEYTVSTQNRITVTDQPTAVLDQGPTIQIESGPVWIFGPRAQNAWQAIGAAAGDSIVGVEYLDP